MSLPHVRPVVRCLGKLSVCIMIERESVCVFVCERERERERERESFIRKYSITGVPGRASDLGLRPGSILFPDNLGARKAPSASGGTRRVRSQ